MRPTEFHCQNFKVIKDKSKKREIISQYKNKYIGKLRNNCSVRLTTKVLKEFNWSTKEQHILNQIYGPAEGEELKQYTSCETTEQM